MNYLVAVSGGVDSVVLLDVLSRSDNRIIVAHVDHGIRPESAADRRFVQGLAAQYRLPFVGTQLNLGSAASEDTARRGRYEFLGQQAKQHRAVIVTGHHRDDMIGSVAINLLRGTGWRGLAVLGRSDVVRPLIGWRKQAIYDYAISHQLEWVEDETNSSEQYLRNRLRRQVIALSPAAIDELENLRARQLQLVREIDREAQRLVERFGGDRHSYTMLPTEAAIELLRHQYKLTRPSAERLLLGIKTARPHTKQTIGGGLLVKYHKKTFAASYD